MEPISVTIKYWTYPDGSPTGREPDGIEDFRNSLSASYVSLVRGQAGALGGGLYELSIELVTSISLRDVVGLIAGGVAYDVIKSGAHSLVLRQLISAYEVLRAKNKKENIEVEDLKLTFQDADLFIRRVTAKPLFDSLGEILKQVADNYTAMKGKTGEVPFEVHIPVFEDPEKRLCRFRDLLDVDETIENITQADYFRYWGVRYNLEGQVRVFDVSRKLLIDERYLTRREYWEEWHRDWVEKRRHNDNRA